MAIELCIEEFGEKPIPELGPFLEDWRGAEVGAKIRNTIFAGNRYLHQNGNDQPAVGMNDSLRYTIMKCGEYLECYIQYTHVLIQHLLSEF